MCRGPAVGQCGTDSRRRVRWLEAVTSRHASMHTYCMWPAVCSGEWADGERAQISVSSRVRREIEGRGKLVAVDAEHARGADAPDAWRSACRSRTTAGRARRSRARRCPGRAAHTDSADVDAPDCISIAIRTRCARRVTSRWPTNLCSLPRHTCRASSGRPKIQWRNQQSDQRQRLVFESILTMAAVRY